MVASMDQGGSPITGYDLGFSAKYSGIHYYRRNLSYGYFHDLAYSAWLY
ncbi:hypothetical protein ACNKHR_23545 [Shigella flexneri]